MPDIEPFVRHLMQNYGYHAVPFALLSDPGGVPWPWIVLMMLANESGKNVWVMLLYGTAVLMAADQVTYWMGALGERALLLYVQPRWPKMAASFEAARQEVAKRGAVAVIFGRYLMFIGRWAGLGAGMAGIPYGQFTVYSTIGCALSAIGFGLPANLIGRQAMKSKFFYEGVAVLFVVGMISGFLLVAVLALRKKFLQKNSPDAEVPANEPLPAIDKAETL